MSEAGSVDRGLKPVVVVGASLAGLSAVQAMRSGGFDSPVVVVDSSPELPHDRPPLSKQVLSGDWDLDRAALPMAASLSELDVDLRLGVAATGLSPAERVLSLSDGSSIEASGFVLAVGSAARNIPGNHPLGVHTLRTGADCLELRAALDAESERVVVIGAGFIGAEVAATAIGRGLQVTLVEALEVPLQRVLPPQLGYFVADLHASHGVDVRTSTGVERFLGDDHGKLSAVELSDGSVVETTVALVAIGAAPELSWLADSGLSIREPSAGGGIDCDAALVAAEGVVVAGDAASWPNPAYGGERMRVEHWENAIEQGGHAGRQLLAEIGAGDSPGEFSSIPWFWTDQYDAKIQMAGRSDPSDEIHIVDGSVEEGRFVAVFKRGEQCRGALAVNRPRHAIRARMQLAQTLDWEPMAALFEG